VSAALDCFPPPLCAPHLPRRLSLLQDPVAVITAHRSVDVVAASRCSPLPLLPHRQSATPVSFAASRVARRVALSSVVLTPVTSSSARRWRARLSRTTASVGCAVIAGGRAHVVPPVWAIFTAGLGQQPRPWADNVAQHCAPISLSLLFKLHFLLQFQKFI
jgi:hypothetical protein